MKRSFTDSYAKSKKSENDIAEELEQLIERNVLVLGKDSDAKGMKQIARIEEVVRYNHYKPVSLKKLSNIKYLSLESKMRRIASICKFVIVEDSRPSGHIDEVSICRSNEFVTATMKQAGKGATWMQAYYPLVYPLISRFCYHGRNRTVEDKTCDGIFESLEEATEAGIRWADSKLDELSMRLGRYNP